MSIQAKPLTVLGHLGELRNRLVWSVIVLTITVGISFIFADRLFGVLLAPAADNRPDLGTLFDILIRGVQPALATKMIYTEMTEMIGTYMKVCLFGGIVLAAPFIIYQVIMFVAPALTSKEKKYLYLVMPWVCFMFVIGVLFGYFVLLPPAIAILTTFGSEYATALIKIGNYISIVTRLLLAIGLVFELPVISTFLARIGVLKSQWLAAKRKWAVVGAFVMAAMITPTFDPVNQTFMAAPLIVLFEMSIWLAKLVQPREKKAVPAPSADANL